MAKAAPKATATATKKPSTTTIGTWDFAGKDIAEIPVGLGRTNSTQKLPFDWDAYAKTTKVSKLIEVPAKFWTDGRGYEAAEVTAPKVRERINRAFYGWKTNKKHKAERAKFSLGFSDQADKGVYTGTHMYFMVAAPAK